MANLPNNLLQNYLQIPIITRTYLTACTLTTLAVQLDIISPFQLYFNPTLILQKWQFWRLITTFLFYGSFGFSFIFNMVFTFRYCRMLEEGSFRSRPADFLFMLMFGAVLFILIAPFVNLLFLGQAFTIMLVYVWSKHSPYIPINLLGLFTFYAPYLPWVLLGFSLLLGNSVLVDLLGIAVGHIYYFLEDVFPNLPGGFRVLRTPRFLKYIFETFDPDYQPLVEEERNQVAPNNIVPVADQVVRNDQNGVVGQVENNDHPPNAVQQQTTEDRRPIEEANPNEQQPHPHHD